MHLCVFVVVLGLCLDHALGSYRVLGWKVHSYTLDRRYLFRYWLNPGPYEISDSFVAINYRFGEGVDRGFWFNWVYSLRADILVGRIWLDWGGYFCRLPEDDATGYCTLKIKVTEATQGGHYQIMGGRTKYYDKSSRFSAGETTWGITTVGEEQPVNEGFTWVGSWVNGWGYAYRYFYVKWTEEPSLTQAFSVQASRRNNRNMTQDANIHGNTRDGQKTVIDEFQGWTYDLGDNTLMQFVMYVAPTTLVAFEPQLDQKTLISSNEGTSGEQFRERIMVNDGCGSEYVEGQTGTLTTSQTITIEESVSYTKSFEFGFSVSYEASFDIGVVSNTLTVSSEFSYSTSSEFSQTKTNTEEAQYQWPTYCEPGNKCKTTLYITKMLYQIPVIFTFNRNGETFTETNTMVTRVEGWHDKVWKPEPTGTSCTK